MSFGSQHDAVVIRVVGVIGHDKNHFFEIERPKTEDDHPELRISSRAQIFSVKYFDGHGLNIFEGLHFYFFKDFGMGIVLPGWVELMYLGDGVEQGRWGGRLD